MDLVIHTYGHIDAMFYVLNGMAMLMSSPMMDGLIKSMLMLSIAYYGLQTVYAGSSTIHKQYVTKVLGMVIIISAALVPKADMLIVDHVTKKKEIVSNLPQGFAVPVGILEAFGDILVQKFEQAFTGLNSSNYRDYGMIFGARLVQDARNWRIKTPEFAENMDNFIKGCVIRKAAHGKVYTINDVLTTDNIWELVSTKAGTMKRVSMRKGNSKELVTCKDAADKYIESAFEAETKLLIRKKGSTDFASASKTTNFTGTTAITGVASASNTTTFSTGVASGVSATTVNTLNNMLTKNIQMVFGSYLGTNKTAETLVRQQMIIHSIDNFKDEFGVTRASMQQETSWRIIGELGEIYLPMLLTILKCLTYAAFIFMVPLMLMGGGGTRYVSYLTFVASMQLWPCLNAVLNMIIDLYSAKSLRDIADGIISFTTYSEVGNYSDKIVAVAAGMQVFVPWLSYHIVQGGVGGFMHMAGNITGGVQSAASSVASEVVSGNRSFDNISSGNMQIAMQQGFKTDWNQSYASGASQYQHMDGTMERVLANGDTIFHKGPGITESSGANKINMRDDTQQSLQLAYNNEERILDSIGNRYAATESHQRSNVNNWVKSLAKHVDAGGSIDYKSLGSSGDAVQAAVNHELQTGEGYNYNRSQTGMMRGSAEVAVDVKAVAAAAAGMAAGPAGAVVASGLAKITPVEAKASVSGNYEAADVTSQEISERNSNTRSEHWDKNYNKVLEAAQNDSFNQNHNIDKSLSRDIQSTASKSKELSAEYTKHEERAQSLQHQMQQVQSFGASYDIDATKLVHEKLVDSGMSSLEALNVIDDPTSTSPANRVKLNKARNQVRDQLMGQISAVPERMDVAEKFKGDKNKYDHDTNEFKQHFSGVVHDSQQRGRNQVERLANKNGVSDQKVGKIINAQAQELTSKHNNMQSVVTEQATQIQDSNLQQLDKARAKINEEEDKRYYKGAVGRNKPKDY
jgi:hypothetical protein